MSIENKTIFEAIKNSTEKIKKENSVFVVSPKTFDDIKNDIVKKPVNQNDQFYYQIVGVDVTVSLVIKPDEIYHLSEKEYKEFQEHEKEIFKKLEDGKENF